MYIHANTSVHTHMVTALISQHTYTPANTSSLVTIPGRALKAAGTRTIQSSGTRKKTCGSSQETPGSRYRELTKSGTVGPVTILPVTVGLTLLLLCDLMIWAEERGMSAQMTVKSATRDRYAEIKAASRDHV